MFRDQDRTYKSIVPRTQGMNEKMAFDAWMELGSLPRAAKYMYNQGLYNRRLNKAFSTFAVRHAACRYIAIHHDKARPVLLAAWRDAGVIIPIEDWNRFVVETASKYLSSSKNRFMRWLDANSWAHKYDYIYAERYGLEAKNHPEV